MIGVIGATIGLRRFLPHLTASHLFAQLSE